MTIDPAGADVLDVYRTLIGMVTPRPIAWVTTTDRLGRVNLAPFSFFNVFGSDPPVVVFSPTLKRDGCKKDTLLNIEETGEFVINCAVESVIEALNLTSAELARGKSEADLAGLELIPSERVKPPRVAASPAHLECRLIQVLPIGNAPSSANLVIGEVVFLHVSDDVIGSDGRIDPRKLKTVGRLGGDFYAKTSDLFELPRPAF